MSRMQTLLPDYGGASLVNLMQSLAVGLGGEGLGYRALRELPVEEVAAAQHVVLLVVDGLGYSRVVEQVPDGCLRGHLRGRMTSVFPSTTATAITAFLTGLAPRQHAMTGWHMYLRELGAVLAVLPGRLRGAGVVPNNGESLARRLYGHVPVFDRLRVTSHAVVPQWIAHSDYNTAHLGQARVLPYDTLEGMFEQCSIAAQSGTGRGYTYAYWPRLDMLSHEHGAHSEPALAHLRELDEALERFIDRMRGADTLVIVTADHGFIDTTAEDRIDLADHPDLADCLRLPLCGEPRVAYCYLRPGRADMFERYVRDALAGKADRYPSLALIEQGWFGPGASHGELEARIGDYTLVMRDRYVIKDWLPLEKRYTHIGVHGGISAEEMRVPLIVAPA